MSKLNDIIGQYCPNGVKYKELKEFAEYAKERIDASEVDEYSYVGVDNLLPEKQGKRESTFVPMEGRLTKYVEGDILIGNIRPYLKKIWLAENEGGTNGDVLAIHITDPSILPKYLYYCLSSDLFFLYDMQHAKGAKMPRGSKEAVMGYKIPTPPIEVQSEIVVILDGLKICSTELSESLSAELSARRKQYDYYLNRFFELQEDNLIPLCEVGSLKRGKRFVHKDATEEGIPCIHYGELYTFYGVYADRVKSHIRKELRPQMRYAHKNDVIIVGAGENNEDIGIGVAWEGEEEVAVHDACYTFSHEQNPRYISYYLRSKMYHRQIKRFVSEGKICAISAEGIGKALIPIPSKKDQDRIVSILSRLENNFNSICIELSAEIDARKKQFEYYREKVLALDELE